MNKKDLEKAAKEWVERNGSLLCSGSITQRFQDAFLAGADYAKPRWRKCSEEKMKAQTNKYILKGKEVIPCDNLLEWKKWMEVNDRIIKQERGSDGAVTVSTVFLGLDHSYSGRVPFLFETMIFGGEHDGYMGRRSTYDEALEMHERALEILNNG